MASTINLTNLSYRVASSFPELKKELKIAHIRKTPQQFTAIALKNGALYGSMFSILFFFVIRKAGMTVLLMLPIFLGMFAIFFYFEFLKLKSAIKKRESEIDREVLFAGRYLLIKLYAGRPLLNALIETSNSYGVASKYIKEIVHDIDTGRTIEDALSNAVHYSPSEKFKKILFQVNNALKLGIDVTKPLEAVIEEITREEIISIKRYGKKLNTMVIFYMLMAIIMPSLGTTMFVVVASFINFRLDIQGFLVIIFFLMIIQFVFISTFKAIRPRVNL